MKTKIFIFIIVTALAFACNSEKSAVNEAEEHQYETEEGIVVLNEKQRHALNLKLGAFQMRNLTTVVKTNGQLEVPPSSSADISAIVGGNVKEI